MVSLEQVKLLESKVTRAIDYLKKVTEEKAQLIAKMDLYQKRIDELEVLIQRFKDDQSRIEDGILSALDRLNQFEDALDIKHGSERHTGGEAPSGQASRTLAAETPNPLQPDTKDSESGELDIF